MVYNAMAGTHRDWGRLADALHWGKRSWLAHGSPPWGLSWFPDTYEQLGMPDAADTIVSLMEQYAGDVLFHKAQSLHLRLVRGNLADSGISIESLEEYFGLDFKADVHPELLQLSAFALIAAGLFEDGIELLEPLVELPSDVGPYSGFDPESVEPALWILYAHRQTGDSESAAPIENWLTKVAEQTRDPQRPFYGLPEVRMRSALFYAAEGNLGDAAAAARVAFEAGWRAYHMEKNSPIWRGAWQSAELAPLVADILADLERQRAEVLAAETESDIRAEFEASISAN
jgi:hypothetical protein